MMKAEHQILHWFGFAEENFVGGSLLATQDVWCREQARSHRRSSMQLFAAWIFALFIGLLPVSPLLAAAAPTPEISLSLRGVADRIVEQGEPLRVVVRLQAPRGTKEAITLAPASGTWADALTVELLQATSAAVAARAETTGKPDASSATLDAKHVAGGLWRFSPETMLAVAPGSYRLRVQLKIDSGRGWKGVSAREMPLTVVAPVTKPSAQRIVNRAQDLLLTDKVQEAATLVDAELKNVPRDYALLKVRALIAEKAGNPYAAIMCLNAANFSTAKKTAGQPPAEDGEMLARLEKLRKTASANPPAWSWPPAEVLLALSEEAKKSSFIPAMPLDRAPGARIEAAPAAPTGTPPRSPVPSAATPPLPAQAPAALPSSATPIPAAPAGPSPGVIVPATETNDATIIADPNGQWAAEATAGSQYSSPQYAAAQATGAPNIALGMAGDNPDAWCPGKKNDGTDWLEVSFAKPVHATEVRVRQNNAPGAIAKIEAIEPNGTTHVWWEGKDPFVAPAIREIAWFAVRMPKTAYVVAKVKITLNLATVPGWKQIDAVQLVGVAE